LINLIDFPVQLGAVKLGKGKDKPKTSGFFVLSPDFTPRKVKKGSCSRCATDIKSGYVVDYFIA